MNSEEIQRETKRWFEQYHKSQQRKTARLYVGLLLVVLLLTWFVQEANAFDFELDDPDWLEPYFELCEDVNKLYEGHGHA